MKILFIISAFIFISCNGGKNAETGKDEASKNSSETKGKWTNEEQVTFMDDCIANAGPDINNDSTQIYCACMLTKAQSDYPKFADVEKNMTIQQVNKWASECLGK
jgi:hypothetical protein